MRELRIVLVCGDRGWKDAEPIARELRKRAVFGPFVVVTGGAPGADTIVVKEAFKLRLPVWVFPADWKHLGKAAGPTRNQQMLTEARPDEGLAFHRFLPNSKGTKDMVERLRKAGVPVEIHTD